MQETSVQKISDGTLPSQMLLAISVSRPNDSMQRQIFYFLTSFCRDVSTSIRQPFCGSTRRREDFQRNSSAATFL
jgi:hypothetical protein